jgi:hypothetical protein
MSSRGFEPPIDAERRVPTTSRHPERLQRSGLRVAVEHRIDVLHDVRAHVEEVPLVLDGDEGSLRAVVLRDLEGLGQGAQRLDVALDAEVAEDEEAGRDGRTPERELMAATKKAMPISASTLLFRRSITSTWRSVVSNSRARPSSFLFALR